MPLDHLTPARENFFCCWHTRHTWQCCRTCFVLCIQWNFPTRDKVFENAKRPAGFKSWTSSRTFFLHKLARKASLPKRALNLFWKTRQKFLKSSSLLSFYRPSAFWNSQNGSKLLVFIIATNNPPNIRRRRSAALRLLNGQTTRNTGKGVRENRNLPMHNTHLPNFKQGKHIHPTRFTPDHRLLGYKVPDNLIVCQSVKCRPLKIVPKPLERKMRVQSSLSLAV